MVGPCARRPKAPCERTDAIRVRAKRDRRPRCHSIRAGKATFHRNGSARRTPPRRSAGRAQGDGRVPHGRVHAVWRRPGRLVSNKMGLYTPECRECEFCLNPKTNLCQKIRATQGQGLMPDGTSRFSMGGKKLFHYMGTSTFANYTVLPEIALAKIREDAPFDKVCYIGCGVTTGIGAVIYTAKVEAGANVVVFGLGGIGLNVIQGAKMVGADKIIGVDINPSKRAMAEKFGMTHFINPKEVGNDKVVAAIVDATDG